MSKGASRLLKAAEKFRKNAEKEMEHIRDLQEKSQRLAPIAASTPLVAQLLDRVKQKQSQSSGDLIWIDQYLGQLRAEATARPSAETAGDKPESDGKDAERKKKPKAKSK